MLEPLLHFVTALFLQVIGRLRGRHRTHIAAHILNRTARTPEDVRRMVEELMRGEAELWREITEGAMRELGLSYPHKPLDDYTRAPPRAWPELRSRLLAYQRMLRDPEGCARRLIAHLRKDMTLCALDRLRDNACAVIDTAPRITRVREPCIFARAHAHPAIHPP